MPHRPPLGPAPLRKHFYIVKREFTRENIFSLISSKVLISTHNLCFEQEHEIIIFFSFEIVIFTTINIRIIMHRHGCLMSCKWDSTHD